MKQKYDKGKYSEKITFIKSSILFYFRIYLSLFFKKSSKNKKKTENIKKDRTKGKGYNQDIWLYFSDIDQTFRKYFQTKNQGLKPVQLKLKYIYKKISLKNQVKA